MFAQIVILEYLEIHMRPPEKMFRTIWHEDEKYICVRDYTDHLRRAMDMVEMMAGTTSTSSQAVLDTIQTTIEHLEQI